MAWDDEFGEVRYYEYQAFAYLETFYKQDVHNILVFFIILFL